MRNRHIASFALVATTALTVSAAPAIACDNPSCFEARPAAAQPEATTPIAKPLALSKYVRKPIATAAVRTTKTRSGHYVQVAYTHRSKAKTEPKPLDMPARPESAAATPAAEALASAADQAFGSMPYSTARVRVVTPEDLQEIDAQATQAAFAPAPIANNAPVTAYNGVQVVSADDVNAIDLKADPVTPAALDAAPAKAPSENATMLQRMLLALGGAFATAAAAVKALVG